MTRYSTGPNALVHLQIGVSSIWLCLLFSGHSYRCLTLDLAVLLAFTEKKKQYLQLRLQIAPLGLAGRRREGASYRHISFPGTTSQAGCHMANAYPGVGQVFA
jgi:hypothetical protein